MLSIAVMRERVAAPSTCTVQPAAAMARIRRTGRVGHSSGIPAVRSPAK